MKAVTFSGNFSLMFDWNGINHVASGCAPHNPNQVRVVLQNCETTKISAELDKKCIEAVDAGENALKSFIRANFTPKGRAIKQWDYAMNEEECEE